jgi:hypothetical protein
LLHDGPERQVRVATATWVRGASAAARRGVVSQVRQGEIGR